MLTEQIMWKHQCVAPASFGCHVKFGSKIFLFGSIHLFSFVLCVLMFINCNIKHVVTSYMKSWSGSHIRTAITGTISKWGAVFHSPRHSLLCLQYESRCRLSFLSAVALFPSTQVVIALLACVFLDMWVCKLIFKGSPLHVDLLEYETSRKTSHRKWVLLSLATSPRK